jgi:hypothetical protein
MVILQMQREAIPLQNDPIIEANTGERRSSDLLS